MAVARKDVADKLNESALQAVVVTNQVLNGEIEGINANARLGAAKLILNKVVPDLRAVDLSGEIKAELGKITIDLAND